MLKTLLLDINQLIESLSNRKINHLNEGSFELWYFKYENLSLSYMNVNLIINVYFENMINQLIKKVTVRLICYPNNC